MIMLLLSCRHHFRKVSLPSFECSKPMALRLIVFFSLFMNCFSLDLMAAVKRTALIYRVNRKKECH